MAGDQVVQLQGAIGDDQALSLLHQLQDQTADIRLDLSGVTALDLKTLELLLSARRTALTRGRGFAITSVSTAAEEAINRAGLAAVLLIGEGAR